MIILGLDKLSLVDYPQKTSAVIFTGGCNFKCPFCHNAGIVYGREMQIPEQEVFDYLLKRKGLLDAVCISGGEPTLHSDLTELIDKIKSLGFLVKLDTNGTNPEMLESLIADGKLDYVAMDIKNGIEDYSKITGCNSEKLISDVKQSVEILLKNEVSYEFRTTLVNEFHTEKSIEEMGKLINGAEKIYLQKFVENDNCISQGLSEVPLETAQKYKDILSKSVKNVYFRGY